MQFQTPDAFWLLLLLPALASLVWWSVRRKRKKAAALGDPELIERLSLGVSPLKERVKLLLLAASVFFLVLAIARPQWGRGEQEVFARGVDVFLVLDTSFSMDAPDVAPSRMERARYVASQLMDRLQGNRLGLVVFSGTAFVQCPLTLDYGAARIFLDTVTTGIVPEPGTDIVRAIEAAKQGFVARDSQYKVVVLLTDGEQQTGDVIAVAEEARDEGIVIHAVGVGTPGGEPIPILDEQGEVTDYVRDDEGQPVLSRLDEQTLTELAVTTGGKYFRVSGRDEEIGSLATLIMSMEGEELESQLLTRYQERYYWPLALSLVLLVVDTLLGRERRQSRQSEEATV
jgi:Ca-activated chloride channel family protein